MGGQDSFSVSSYTEFLTLVDMVKTDMGMDENSEHDAIVPRWAFRFREKTGMRKG